MAAVLLAVLSAASDGLPDFLGGLLSRTSSAWPVAVAGQASAAACTGPVALAVVGHPRTGHFAMAITAALGSGTDRGRGHTAPAMGAAGPGRRAGHAHWPARDAVYRRVPARHPAPLPQHRRDPGLPLPCRDPWKEHAPSA